MPCICARFGPNTVKSLVPDSSYMPVRCSNGLRLMSSPHHGGEFCAENPRVGGSIPPLATINMLIG
jgi:hypothetical protein